MKVKKKITILVTGCVGFIGFHVSNFLTTKGYNVIGIDNINTYYDIKLKKDRLNILKKKKNFNFYKVDISNNLRLKKIFAKYEISIKNISYYNYVKDFKINYSDNLFGLTNKLLNGLNPKEISFKKRSYQKQSFFEKFFNFFK